MVPISPRIMLTEPLLKIIFRHHNTDIIIIYAQSTSHQIPAIVPRAYDD